MLREEFDGDMDWWLVLMKFFVIGLVDEEGEVVVE